MRVVQLIALLVLAGVLTAVSICRPGLLAANEFLLNFVNHNYISILAVIVTVSLVSITQIHLEYSRVERRFKTRVFQEPRSQINLSALLLTATLVIGFIISFVRAEVGASLVVLSFLHSGAILTMLLVVFLMYDLIRVVYVLAADEPIEDESEQG